MLRKSIVVLGLLFSIPVFACDDLRVQNLTEFQSQCLVDLSEDKSAFTASDNCLTFTGVMSTITVEKMFLQFDKSSTCYAELERVVDTFQKMQQYVTEYQRTNKIKI